MLLFLQQYVWKMHWNVLLMVVHNVNQATLAQTAVTVTLTTTELQTELVNVSTSHFQTVLLQ